MKLLEINIILIIILLLISCASTGKYHYNYSFDSWYTGNPPNLNIITIEQEWEYIHKKRIFAVHESKIPVSISMLEKKALIEVDIQQAKNLIMLHDLN